jgi:hypothetical protein
MARLLRTPTTACVVGLLGAVALSHLAQFDFQAAFGAVLNFGKIVIYYLLLVTVVDSPRRLRTFLFWLWCFTSALTLLAVLDYYGYISVAGLAEVRQRWTQSGSDADVTVEVVQLCGSGIFGNPNDLSRILVVGILVNLYHIAREANIVRRTMYVASLLLMGGGLQLTYSRGGFTSLAGGLTCLAWSRYGGIRSALIAVVVLPLLFALFAGRQTDLNVEQGTGQQRIHLWNEGFELMRSSPLFGIGSGQYAEQVGLVAHNSFVQFFVETGFVGGTLFSGAFFASFWALRRSIVPANRVDTEMVRIRPYVVAILAGYAVGMLSSTRSYTTTTYVVLGLAGAYAQLLAGRLGIPILDGRMVRRILLAGLFTLTVLYLSTRFAFQQGKSW